jgi:hypothetical protein
MITHISAQLPDSAKNKALDHNPLIPPRTAGVAYTAPPRGRSKTTRQVYRSFGILSYTYQYSSQPALWRDQSDVDEGAKDEVHEEWRMFPVSWLKHHSITFSWTKSLGNWQYSLKTTRVFDHNSPTYEACKYGDIMKLRRLLTDGSASLSDVDEYGDTLLHVSRIARSIHLWNLFFTPSLH